MENLNKEELEVNGTTTAYSLSELRIYNSSKNGSYNSDNLTTTDTNWTTYDFNYTQECAESNFYITGDIIVTQSDGNATSFILGEGAYRMQVQFANGGVRSPHGIVEYRIILNDSTVAISNQTSLTGNRTFSEIPSTIFEAYTGSTLEVQMRSVDGNTASLDYLVLFLEQIR